MTITANARKWFEKYRQQLLSLGIYILATLAMTYPTIFKMSRVIYGEAGDSFYYLWLAWWRKYSFIHGLDFKYLSLAQAPFGTDIVFPVYPVLINSLGFFSLIFNEIAAYNLLILIAFILSGFLTYLVAFQLTHNQTASIAAGLIFMFSPQMVVRAKLHVTLVQQWVYPLLLLALLNLRRKQTIGAALWLAGVFAIISYLSMYFLYYAALGAVIFATVELVYEVRAAIKEKNSLKPYGRRIMLYVLAASVALLLFVPVLLPILKTLRGGPESLLRPANTLERNEIWPFTLSTRPWHFLLPAEFNPILGRYSEQAYEAIKGLTEKGYIDTPPRIQSLYPKLGENWFLVWENPFERMVYLGYVNLIMAGYAVWHFFNRSIKRVNDLGLIIPFLMTAFVLGILFSLPPYIPVGGFFPKSNFTDFVLPMPSLLTTTIANPLRGITRVAPLVMISLALLVSIGLNHLLDRVSFRWVIMVVFIGVLGVEFAHLPGVTPMPTPEEIHWLAEQPRDTIVATYPYGSRLMATYQRIHELRVVDSLGFDGNLVYDNVYNIEQYAIGSPEQPDAANKLAALGTSYVVNGDLPIETPEGLLLLFTTDTAQVFEVSAEPARLVVLHTLQDGLWKSEAQWEAQESSYQIVVWNPLNSPAAVDVEVVLAEAVNAGELLGWRELTPPPTHVIRGGILVLNPDIQPPYDPEPITAEGSSEGLIFPSMVFHQGETYLTLEWVGEGEPLAIKDVRFTVIEPVIPIDAPSLR